MRWPVVRRVHARDRWLATMAIGMRLLPAIGVCLLRRARASVVGTVVARLAAAVAMAAGPTAVVCAIVLQSAAATCVAVGRLRCCAVRRGVLRALRLVQVEVARAAAVATTRLLPVPRRAASLGGDRLVPCADREPCATTRTRRCQGGWSKHIGLGGCCKCCGVPMPCWPACG
jgi:hypothetical protein